MSSVEKLEKRVEKHFQLQPIRESIIENFRKTTSLVEVDPHAGEFLVRDATDDEIDKLPHIIDKLPPEAWAAAVIGASERFSYYCFVSIWRE